MKDGVPAWSVVMVVPKGTLRVLAINRSFNPRDPAFPGGDSEPADDTPAVTAKRELWEETGLEALEVKCVDSWTGSRGQPVYAFVVTRWKGRRIRPSDEGKPFWTHPNRLLIPTATYREDSARLLRRVAQMRDRLP